jgi:isopentenyl-diphosphate delta-isomerase
MTDMMIPAWVDGTLTPVEKLDVHVRGLRHKAISVFVMDGDDVLLQRRALCKYHTPGLWANTCCTHPHWNEPAADCANRRLEEELGIHGLDLELRDRIEYRAEVGNDLIEHEVVDIFIAQMDKSQCFEPNPLEVVQTRWMSLADTYKQVMTNSHKYTPWLKIYMSRYGKKIFGDQSAWENDLSVNESLA